MQGSDFGADCAQFYPWHGNSENRTQCIIGRLCTQRLQRSKEGYQGRIPCITGRSPRAYNQSSTVHVGRDGLVWPAL